MHERPLLYSSAPRWLAIVSSLTVAAALVLLCFAAGAPAAGLAAGGSAASLAASPLELLADQAKAPAASKIAPDLSDAVTGLDPAASMVVVVKSAVKLDLSAYASRVHQFTWPAGEQVALLRVPVRDIARLAAVPGVSRVQSGELDPTRRPARSMGVTHGPAELAPAKSGSRPHVPGTGVDVANGATAGKSVKEKSVAARPGGPSKADLSVSEAAAAPQDLAGTEGLATRDGLANTEGLVTRDGLANTEGLVTRDGLANTEGLVTRDGRALADGPATRDGLATTDGLASPAGLAGWWDVGLGHAAMEAWALGFQGQGVKVAVMDTGVDFGHPDLQNTWAVFPAGHPDAGWPQVYDPMSAYQYVRDLKVEDPNAPRLTATAEGTLIATYQESEVEHHDSDTGDYHTACFKPLIVDANGKHLGEEDCDYLVPESMSEKLYYGHHPDTKLASILSDDSSGIEAEYVGVLLVDEKTAGVYDTIYVDTNADHDFTDEKPATKESPLAVRDLDKDGITDLNGGLLYYVADGTRPIPAAYLWGLEKDIPAAHSLVGLFVDTDDHGSLCSSAAVSQGRLGIPESMPELRFRDLPGDGRPEAANPGMAPRAKLVGVGNVYDADIVYDAAWRYAVFGNDKDRDDDDIQVVSNSYGWSDVADDGWDKDSRAIDYYVRKFSPTTLFVWSTGNGGPGYGTISPPLPVTGLRVGASTQNGAGDAHSITDTTQILYGDVVPFSNRGPSALGDAGPNVAANGATGFGAVPINFASVSAVLENPDHPLGAGQDALTTWAGTSRSTPLTAGGLALIYQAFKSANNRWPTWEEAKALVMGGARYTGYDVFTVGAGVLDAGDATRLASGKGGVYSLPPDWTAGGYHAKTYQGFAKLLTPGSSAKQTFTLKNPGDQAVDATLMGRTLKRVGTVTTKLKTKLASESPYDPRVPDYLWPIDKTKIPAGTDLMVVRTVIPYSKSDLDGDSDPLLENNFDLAVIQHTDVDHDGKLWDDADGDGGVGHESEGSADEPGDVDWSNTELDRWEFETFSINNAWMNNKEMYVHHPLERWKDGMYLAWWHTAICDDPTHCHGRNSQVPATEIPVQLDFYTYQDWPWLSLSAKTQRIPAKGEVTVEATFSVPAGAAAGAYQGAILADYARPAGDQPVPAGGGYELPQRRLVVPVNANVAATYDWKGTVGLGGPAANDADATYSNGLIRGPLDRTWREETGDWRYFFVDTPVPEAGTYWLAKTQWNDGSAEKSDIDTFVWGARKDRYSDPDDPENASSSMADPDWYGPHGLERVAGSAPSFVGGGTWSFKTSSKGPSDWVAGLAKGGLAEVLLHNVVFGGGDMGLPFSTTLSSVQVSPQPIQLAANQCTSVRITSQVDLPGFGLQAIGLSQPQAMAGQKLSAGERYTYELHLPSPAARFIVDIKGQPGQDIDLYLVYDANHDGVFDQGEQIAASTSSSEVEHIELDGLQPAGDYQIQVDPYDIKDAMSSTFDLNLDVITGDNLAAQNVPADIKAGQAATVKVCATKLPTEEGPLNGAVVFGPQDGPGIVTVPVRWVKSAASPPDIFLPFGLQNHTLP